MDVTPCPRCGEPVPPLEGRGRPRRWCGDRCRRLASEEKRAAERNAIGLQVRDHIRVVERVTHRPLSPNLAVERVMTNNFAVEKFLRTLTHRIRDGATDTSARWILNQRPYLVADLVRAIDETRRAKDPSAPSFPAGTVPAADLKPVTPANAVTAVMASPRAIREVLDALTELARDGHLLDGRHSGTVNASQRLLQALIDSRTLRLN